MQERAVAHLRFEDASTSLVVRASVDGDTGYVRIDHATARARKNTVDIFPAIVGEHCHGVMKIDGDRIITVMFTSGNLHLEFFSGGKGNILLEHNGIVRDALHDRASVESTPFVVDARPLSLGPLLERDRANYDDIVTAYRESRTAYVLEDGGDMRFSMLPLSGMRVVDRSEDVLGLIHRVAVERYKQQRRDKIRKEIRVKTEREIKKLEKALEAMRSEEAQADRAAERRMIADLLMSTPDLRRRDLEQIQLNTWTGESIDVKLDPKRSILENAQDYYAKAKRSEVAAVERRRRIPKTESRLNELRSVLAQAMNTDDLEVLQRLSPQAMSPQQPSAETSPYRVFVLDEEHTLYVGKNAANNDQLTMKFAKQNDWWFHARGTSGSHCVLRGPGSSKPPKAILEQAAAIAAYYSGSRNASWTPVVYTQRKYVRKPKGANVGAVVLEREEVIMVKPSISTGS